MPTTSTRCGTDVRSDSGVALMMRGRGDGLVLSLEDAAQHRDGSVHVEVSESVEPVLEVDPRITVKRTTPTLRLAIRFAGLAGGSIHARLRRQPASIPAVWRQPLTLILRLAFRCRTASPSRT